MSVMTEISLFPVLLFLLFCNEYALFLQSVIYTMHILFSTVGNQQNSEKVICSFIFKNKLKPQIQ